MEEKVAALEAAVTEAQRARAEEAEATARARDTGTLTAEEAAEASRHSTLIQPSFNPHSTLIQPSFNPAEASRLRHSTLIQPSFNPHSTPRRRVVCVANTGGTPTRTR